MDNFTLALTENPVGIHFSGHGVRNTADQVGMQNLHLKKQGDCLVFETEDSAAHFLT
jgi:hypothetical protein